MKVNVKLNHYGRYLRFITKSQDIYMTSFIEERQSVEVISCILLFIGLLKEKYVITAIKKSFIKFYPHKHSLIMGAVVTVEFSV